MSFLIASISSELTNFSHISWAFSLIVDIQNPPGDKRSYTPKSDAELRIAGFPHLLLEVISHENETDRIRMLLQASCLARFGNSLRKPSCSNPLIISAIYINKDLQADWYHVYQQNPPAPEVTILLDREGDAELLAGQICHDHV